MEGQIKFVKESREKNFSSLSFDIVYIVTIGEKLTDRSGKEEEKRKEEGGGAERGRRMRGRRCSLSRTDGRT